MTPTSIRSAGTGDVPALLEMMEDFNAVEAIPWDSGAVEASLRHLLAESSLGLVLVAEGSRGALGYAVATFNYDLEFAGRDAFVTELYVRPVARRVGVARGLLADVERRAAQQDARALHLLVLPDNAPALTLYEAAGFERSPRVMMTRRL
jgi:ribosomal protein S18 acetylase RimI-like enzyme